MSDTCLNAGQRILWMIMLNEVMSQSRYFTFRQDRGKINLTFTNRRHTAIRAHILKECLIYAMLLANPVQNGSS
ncbi:MAG: hypothetical protein OXI04_04400, partial [Bacteroidota bacterium]|nr:hypothetical protein [Bacteroidota bacterium]